MSTVKTNRNQIGISATPTQNFTLTAEAADGSMKLARGNAGATTQDILTVDSAGFLSAVQSPAQFDATLKLATTTFVQQALGSMSGYSLLSGSPTVTAASVGEYIIVNSPGTITLPDPATLPLGSMFTVEGVGANGTVTCTGATSASFSGPNMGASASSAPLADSGVEQFVVVGSQYRVFGGSGKASLGASGYQRLPSGLIIQWGALPATAMTSQSATSVVTYPTTFPTASRAITITMDQTVTGTNTYSAINRSVSGFSLFCNSYASTPNANGSYIAIGH